MPDVRLLTPEEIAEQFIAAAIDRAPEPLKRLGHQLTDILDADDFNGVEPLLLGLAEELDQMANALKAAMVEIEHATGCPCPIHAALARYRALTEAPQP